LDDEDSEVRTLPKDKSRQEHPGELRRRAEEALNRKKTGEPSIMPEEDVRALVHELQVHQIELEMQNEELKRANAMVEETRNRYVDLYELAPIGYLTLAENGIVLEANLTVAVQLGIERSGLIKRPFQNYIVPADRDKFRSHLSKVVTSEKRQSCEIGLMTQSGGDFYALLDTVFILDSSGKQLCRTTATDITERRRAENLVNVRLSLLEFAASHSSEELLQKTLDEIGQLTNSAIGFLHFVESDQKTLSLQAWSTRTIEEFCSAEGKGAHYPIEKAGVWVDCFHEKRPVIHNDYSALPHRKGLPEGHPPVIRELSVPIMRSGRVVAILGIGNKPVDYTQQDIGVASYLADVAWEITQRKRVEEELRENKSRLDHALRSAHMGVWRLDLIENKRHFDDQVCHLLGIAPAKFTGTEEEFYKAVHPDDRETLKAVWVRTIERNVPYETEYRAVWPDGSVHYVAVRGKLVHDDKGQPVSVNGLIWDITERKQAEVALRLRESYLTAILENQPGLVWLKDNESRFLAVNHAFARSCGMERPEEVLGKNDLDIWPRELAEKYRSDDKAVLNRGAPIAVEEAIYDRGEMKWFETFKTPVLDKDGQTLGTSGFARDITERKQMEEELRRSRDELELRVRERTAELSVTVTKLEQLNEELQEFAFIASHDLQEPLRKIQTFGNMLIKKHKDSLSSEGKDYMERVTKAANRMSELLRALLNYSRTGTSELNYKSVSLTAVAKDAASDLEYMIAKAKGTVEISELPTVDADPALLRQLFQNVIGNSMKYRQESEPPIVKIYGSIADSVCQVFIEDNGIGFEEEFTHKIFKPFERLHGRNAPYKGTGMGLAICRKIAARHGGDISARSTPGQGATFIVTLPIEQ